MSDNFFGRPVSRGMDALEFDLCEICQRRSPSWLEVKYEDNTPAVRFACEQCHQEYLDQGRQDSPDIARQISDEEEIPEATRPGWVNEFIEEQQKTGAIQSIDSRTEDEEEDKREIEFSEPPESFEQRDTGDTEEEYVPQQIAPWASKFIQEALFGPNPEGWLEENGAYESGALEITLKTLGSFADHDVTSVKLSSIQCLLGLYNRHQDQKDAVLERLQKYQHDLDDTVKEFATQTIDQLQ